MATTTRKQQLLTNLKKQKKLRQKQYELRQKQYERQKQDLDFDSAFIKEVDNDNLINTLLAAIKQRNKVRARLEKAEKLEFKNNKRNLESASLLKLEKQFYYQEIQIIMENAKISGDFQKLATELSTLKQVRKKGRQYRIQLENQEKEAIKKLSDLQKKPEPLESPELKSAQNELMAIQKKVKEYNEMLTTSIEKSQETLKNPPPNNSKPNTNEQQNNLQSKTQNIPVPIPKNPQVICTVKNVSDSDTIHNQALSKAKQIYPELNIVQKDKSTTLMLQNRTICTYEFVTNTDGTKDLTVKFNAESFNNENRNFHDHEVIELALQYAAAHTDQTLQVSSGKPKPPEIITTADPGAGIASSLIERSAQVVCGNKKSLGAVLDDLEKEKEKEKEPEKPHAFPHLQ